MRPKASTISLNAQHVDSGRFTSEVYARHVSKSRLLLSVHKAAFGPKQTNTNPRLTPGRAQWTMLVK